MTTTLEKQWPQILEDLARNGLGEVGETLAAELVAAASQPLTAPIVGAMKAGKSTLLTRLLDLPSEFELPRDVLQATARCVTLSPSPTAYRAIIDPEQGDAESIDSTTHWEDLIKGKHELPRDARLEIGVRDDWYSSLGIEFVDTPGVNTPTQGLFEVTWAAVQKSHLALYTLDARQLLTAEDSRFIQSVRQVAGAFIFVITQIDLVGARRHDEELVRQLCEHLRASLNDLEVKPLAICAVSSIIQDEEASGRNALRAALSNAGSKKREFIHYRTVARRAARQLLETADVLQSQAMMLAPVLSHDRESYRDKVANLEADLIEARNRASSEERRLKQRLERLELDTLNSLSQHSTTCAEKILRHVETASSPDALEAYVHGPLQAEVDAWRNHSMSLLVDAMSSVHNECDEATRELLARYSEGLSRVFETEIAFVPPPSPNEASSILDESHLRDLENQREQLRQEVERLKMDTSGLGEGEELKTGLQSVLEEMSAIVYEPQYHEVRLDQGASLIQGACKFVGAGVDIALMAAPIPTKHLSFLKSLPKGVEMFNAVKKYNALIGKKNKTLAKMVGGKAKLLGILDKLSVEYWAEQAGSLLGQALLPDQVVKVEDPEVKRAFHEAMASKENEAHQIRCTIALQEGRKKALLRQHEEVFTNMEFLDAEIRRLRGSSEIGAAELRQHLEQLKLLEWQKTVSETLHAHLLDRQGKGWHAEVRRQFTSHFGNAVQNALTAFRKRASDTETELRRALNEVEASFTKDRQEIESEIALLRHRQQMASDSAKRLVELA